MTSLASSRLTWAFCAFAVLGTTTLHAQQPTDPRVGLKWGLFDAGTAASNMELIANVIEELRAHAEPMPEIEVAGWGRLPLAYSARCFTARALDLAKDDCGFRCIDYPDGLPLTSRDGRPFLTINGIQVQTAGQCDLGPELAELRAAGSTVIVASSAAQTPACDNASRLTMP